MRPLARDAAAFFALLRPRVFRRLNLDLSESGRRRVAQFIDPFARHAHSDTAAQLKFECVVLTIVPCAYKIVRRHCNAATTQTSNRSALQRVRAPGEHRASTSKYRTALHRDHTVHSAPQGRPEARCLLKPNALIRPATAPSAAMHRGSQSRVAALLLAAP